MRFDYTAGICIFVRGGGWENAYSSLKGVERPINLYIILFDNHFPFQKSVFVILSHSKYTKKKKKKKKKKKVFLP